MSLRQFLLDYAEKAPKAIRHDVGAHIRFIQPRPDLEEMWWECCPIELATGGWFGSARRFYWKGFPTEMIAAAADNGTADREPNDAERAWRAVLEKLAEPEVA